MERSDSLGIAACDRGADRSLKPLDLRCVVIERGLVQAVGRARSRQKRPNGRQFRHESRLKHTIEPSAASSCNHNRVRMRGPTRFQVAPGSLRWNNYVHNSYLYVSRLSLPFAYRYGANPWRALLLLTPRVTWGVASR